MLDRHRRCFKLFVSTDSTRMLQHLDLPTLQQRRQHSKVIMLYIIRHQLASIPTATYIRPSTMNTQHYILPYARTLVFQTSFFPSTIKTWHNLQPVITNSTTIPRLRKHCNPHQHQVGVGQHCQLRLGGHLTLTNITQQQHANTPTAGRRGATLSA